MNLIPDKQLIAVVSPVTPAPTMATFFKLIPKITLFYCSLTNIEVTISDSIMSDNHTNGHTVPEIILPEVEINLFTPNQQQQPSLRITFVPTIRPECYSSYYHNLSGSGWKELSDQVNPLVFYRWRK